jgi:hypothetical protein
MTRNASRTREPAKARGKVPRPVPGPAPSPVPSRARPPAPSRTADTDIGEAGFGVPAGTVALPGPVNADRVRLQIAARLMDLHCRRLGGCTRACRRQRRCVAADAVRREIELLPPDASQPRAQGDRDRRKTSGRPMQKGHQK